MGGCSLYVYIMIVSLGCQVSDYELSVKIAHPWISCNPGGVFEGIELRIGIMMHRIQITLSYVNV